MEQGTEGLYSKVFTVFGAVTVGLIGLYLLWRSRQADMNNAVTTVAWAVLILVLVTAVVRWPVKAAEYTDQALTIGMNLSTVLINDDQVQGCLREDGMTQDRYDELKQNNGEDFCIDTRTAAVVASDTVSGQVLYQNWLRTMLGQSEEVTFQERDGKPVEDAEGNPIVTDPIPRTSTGLLSLPPRHSPGRRTRMRKLVDSPHSSHRGEAGSLEEPGRPDPDRGP